MQAAVLKAFGSDLIVEDRPLPKLRAGEVLVHVRAAGVCHTDLHIIDGRMQGIVVPRILGHEISGYADGIGEVLVYASWGCGSCIYCCAGTEQLCHDVAEAGWTRDGGYAEYVVVPSSRYLFPLEGIDPIRAAPLADAGLTPYRAVRRLQRLMDLKAATVVIGAGGLGQFAIQYLKLLTGSKVIVVDRDERKLRRAKALGADDIFLAGEPLPRVQAVIDVVGSEESLLQGVACLARGGVLMVIGEAGGSIPFGIGSTANEAWLTSTTWGSLHELSSVLDLARRNQIDWEVETLPLLEVNRALNRLRAGDVAGRLVLTI